MTTETGTTLKLTRTIRADRERVFEAWTDPALLERWSCPEGVDLARVEVDLREGGRYTLHMKGPEGESYTAFGVYREVTPPERLVYTWEWREPEHAVGETLVTVELREKDGATEVVLTHDLFPTAEARDGHQEGWASCLDRLVRLLG